MQDTFITDIKIKKVRHLENLHIELSKDERKHLILTGKNGSGKTSVLKEVKDFLKGSINGDFAKLKKIYKNQAVIAGSMVFGDNFFSNNIKSATELAENRNKKLEIEKKYKSLYINFNTTLKWNDFSEKNNLLIYFPAKRPLENIEVSSGVENLELTAPKNLDEKLNIHFLQYIVNKINDKAQYFMKNDIEKADKIQKWFNNFENLLKKIFNDETLKLDYNVEKKDFFILQKNRDPFNFNEFSDGYKSIFSIVSEIILQADVIKKSYEEIEGVVLIDEIETHLHLEMQKQILPFLTTLFPKVQFIVTTHSPFILNSIDNAVVYDLEQKEEIDSARLKNASYSQIVKNYFQIDSEFSNILERKIEKYEKLIELFEKGEIDEEQEQELFDLDIELDKLSPMLSNEIFLRFKEAQEKILEND